MICRWWFRCRWFRWWFRWFVDDFYSFWGCHHRLFPGRPEDDPETSEAPPWRFGFCGDPPDASSASRGRRSSSPSDCDERPGRGWSCRWPRWPGKLHGGCFVGDPWMKKCRKNMKFQYVSAKKVSKKGSFGSKRMTYLKLYNSQKFGLENLNER